MEPLSDNARPTKKPAMAPPKPKSEALTQMQISLGQKTQTRCKTCGMEYVPSSTEDRKLHDKYHKQNTEGYDVGKDFVSKSRPNTTFPGAKKGDAICILDWADAPARKRRGQAVLEIVQRELGAVGVSEDEIWSMKKNDVLNPDNCNFRAYLYIRGTKCIGFLLEQKIKESYQVQEPPTPATAKQPEDPSRALSTLKARREADREAQNRPLELSNHPNPARLGISRIWTSPTHRSQNIATKLLDMAFEQYNERIAQDEKARIAVQTDARARGVSEHVQVMVDAAIGPPLARLDDKDLVAFSQPTEAGTRLARKWFDEMYGWRVYVD